MELKKEAISGLKKQFDLIINVKGDIEFWYARDLQEKLGYKYWESFVDVIKRAINACDNSGFIVEDHFRRVPKMVKLGSGAERKIDDYMLTRYACYLIAQNGDSKKQEIAFAQTYFAVQTRKQEIIQDRIKLINRLEAREKLKEAEKELSKNIYERGVDDKGFAIIRSKGDSALFGGLNTSQMKTKYGVKGNRPLADFLPTLTIAAKNLATEMTNHNVTEEDLYGESLISSEHVQNNLSVRDMLVKRGIKPEKLKPAEDLKKLKRRVISEEKQMAEGKNCLNLNNSYKMNCNESEKIMNKIEIPKKRQVAFITLGCKVNQYETNGMIQSFENNNYEIVNHNQVADIYVVNTCTVTNMSDRKSRQMLRRVKELNENAIVVACGCYVQVAKEEIENIPEIDIIIGNNEKTNIVKYIEEFEKNKNANIYEEKVSDVMVDREFYDFGDVTYTEKTRAVIKVQDGCDRFCSYCIIPYARGRVRSRNPKSIISEINKIAKNGIKEVVITGIHVASYGKDFKDKYELIDLLEEINQIEGIERIRLSSIEPLIMTDEFLDRLEKLDKICHHFHLSLQSGCDETLKRMNRRYDTKAFSDIVDKIRKKYDDAILTTDIIVGFPGETEDEFEKTYNFLKDIKFYKMHVFKYSPRKGTVAADMKNQIDGNIKEQRSKKLIELSNQMQKYYNDLYLGKEVEVLFEEEKEGFYRGHTKNYIMVLHKSNENLNDKIKKVICDNCNEEYIIAN